MYIVKIWYDTVDIVYAIYVVYVYALYDIVNDIVYVYIEYML